MQDSSTMQEKETTMEDKDAHSSVTSLLTDDISSSDNDSLLSSSFSSFSSLESLDDEEDDAVEHEHQESLDPAPRGRIPPHRRSSFRRSLRLAVSFDPNFDVYYDNVSYSAEEAAQNWYGAQELEFFKLYTTQFVRSVQLGDDAFVKELGAYHEFRLGILTPFEIILQATSSSSSTCSSAHQQQQPDQQQQQQNHHKFDWDNLLLSEDQREEWEEMYTDYPERLGLERTALTRIRKDKAARRYSLLSSIEKLTRSLSSTKTNPEQTAALVRSLCERITLPSRLFARELGRAVHASCDQEWRREAQQSGGGSHWPRALSLASWRHRYWALRGRQNSGRSVKSGSAHQRRRPSARQTNVQHRRHSGSARQGFFW